jgi:hypothetical protein
MEITSIVNGCPHKIVLWTEDGQSLTVHPNLPPVRVLTEAGTKVGLCLGVAIHAPPRVIGIQYLPERREGQIIVVSQLTAAIVGALHPERDDVVFPGTAPHDNPVLATGERRVARRLEGVTRLNLAAHG